LFRVQISICSFRQRSEAETLRNLWKIVQNL